VLAETLTPSAVEPVGHALELGLDVGLEADASVDFDQTGEHDLAVLAEPRPVARLGRGADPPLPPHRCSSTSAPNEDQSSEPNGRLDGRQATFGPGTTIPRGPSLVGSSAPSVQGPPLEPGGTIGLRCRTDGSIRRWREKIGWTDGQGRPSADAGP
jgi:hypothetical protein